MKNLYEIRIHARAGQGSKTMAQLIAEVAASKGYHIQAFPYFGPARSGAPMDAFVRVSKKEIKRHTPIKNPDLLVVLDETLLMMDNICIALDPQQSLLINSSKTREEIIAKYKIETDVFVVNANKIGRDIFQKLFTNTVML
jgi:pyruvate ferredoxin oxidoreductase gamma subunit